MMDAREERYLKYLQQRKQDCEQMGAMFYEQHGSPSFIFDTASRAFEEAAAKFLEMIDERDEAENAF